MSARNQQIDANQKKLIMIQWSIDLRLDFITDGNGPMGKVREKLAELEISKTTIQASLEQ